MQTFCYHICTYMNMAQNTVTITYIDLYSTYVCTYVSTHLEYRLQVHQQVMALSCILLQTMLLSPSLPKDTQVIHNETVARDFNFVSLHPSYVRTYVPSWKTLVQPALNQANCICRYVHAQILHSLLSKALCAQGDGVTNLDKARKQLSVSWQDERFRYSSPGQPARSFKEWSYTHKRQEITTGFK